MSRQAQAEREKQARVINAAIAGKFVEAAMTYADHPTALQLRAMNIIYEKTNERGATIHLSSAMVSPKATRRAKRLGILIKRGGFGPGGRYELGLRLVALRVLTNRSVH
jgi:hypothetical protein